MDLAIFKTSKVSSPFFKIQNLMSDEIPAETRDVFVKFQNSTSWQSWHSSAHACTSSWLTNAVRDAPVASVKVVVSASCLRGKRPSASSKLLRYLRITAESCTFSILLFFSKHASNLSREWSPTLLRTISSRGVKKTKQHSESKNQYYSWKLGNFVFSLHFVHPISFHVALSFCVDSALLRIQTQPWPVWCLNQWGNRLSRLWILQVIMCLPSAKVGKMHEQPFDLYRSL